MAKKTDNLGKTGESIACEYLTNKGYVILRQNWRVKGGEIDVVARAKDKTLVFVEVKTFMGPLASAQELVPEDNITAAKLVKFKRACEMFVAKNQESIDERRGWRIDVVAIEVLPGKQPAIRHYENV
ncbi:MAG: YraN family protein [Patescibacteria group bacterium]